MCRHLGSRAPRLTGRGYVPAASGTPRIRRFSAKIELAERGTAAPAVPRLQCANLIPFLRCSMATGIHELHHTDLPRPLIYAAAVTSGVLAAMTVQILLSRAGLEL